MEGAARARLASISAAVETLGEPFMSLPTSTDMAALLRDAGFTEVTVFSVRRLFGRYLRPPVPAGMEFAEMIHARRESRARS